MAKKNLKLISLLAGFLALPILTWAVFQVTSYLSKAAPKKANIVVDTGNIEGQLTGNWLNFAQGGEEVEGMLTNTIDRMRLLNPKYIRLDHIFDNYEIVRDNGSLNFEKLDKSVDEILKMGGKPLFALSYMPRQFTENKSVIDEPRDWSLWQNLVKQTITHYSGKNNMNLKDVFYEVWNEPDLPQFGSWKIIGAKNYNTLYHYAANGAAAVENTNNFSFGGPAVGSYYPLWVDNFVSYINNNNLRLDFYSWHRYHTNPDKFREDAVNIRKILEKYSKYSNIPLVLSEWGPDSENNNNSSTDKAAAHALSTIFKIHDIISMPFAFEVKDGPPPSGGKWGLITHEKDNSPLNLKPRFKAFAASTYLFGSKLAVNGWGNNVQAMASKSLNGTIYILITNYDNKNSNWENVPLTLTGLSPGLYKKTIKNITTGSSGTTEISSADGQINNEILMLPNSVQLIELKKSGNVSEYIEGARKHSGDRALILNKENDLKLAPVDFPVAPDFVFQFDLRSFFNQESPSSLDMLNLTLETKDKEQMSINLRKFTSKNINFLLLILSSKTGSSQVAIEVNDWLETDWHKVTIGINPDKITFNIDGARKEITNDELGNLARVTGINFYPYGGAIDNLEIGSQGKQLFQNNFD